ncbi:family 16 glycoside hydrolase [Microbacterium sp. HMH0099]|uniref:family 16 glycoside hydrolase n=1 Tax=Microbacterium sp. HMH0099 TaxID=3414026 RepID=UPI003BF6BF6C
MPIPAASTGTRRRSTRVARTLAAGLLGGALVATGAILPAGAAVDPAVNTPADLPQQEQGVTLRTYSTPPLTELCTLKSGQTPNVDKLMSTIDWTTDEQFGAGDNFITHALANLTVSQPGEYAFRLTSDDGSRLTLDGTQIIDNDGLHGPEAVEGTATLDVGVHDLFVEMFEATNGQQLTVEWKTPGSSSFTVIPANVLSTEAGVVRVTAPGTKYCEGSADSAGDGLRLDAVNPNYTLVDLRPAGFTPKVAALDFTDAGDLAVLTTGSVNSGGWDTSTPGKVFLMKNVQAADGPEDVTAVEIASGLQNPMGIDVIGDKIYVSERYQLTELSDPDGDGVFDSKRRVASYPSGNNFHEFAFGLIHDDENFYVNLSVAIDNGGATTNPQPAANRGTTVKINRATGAIEYVAGGLRTPNGIAFGPEDELFAMDNQGAWLPSSKLVHVEQGRFFNHFTNPAGPFDDQPVTQPAVWIPQNEIGNSPSTPILLENGPFAGQMMFGDVTYGGLQRAFLEKVDGEFQGAVFRHSAGFEVGVNRVIEGPDKSLYVGGTGEGGNWGEAGKLTYGLQKLVPNQNNAFDIVSMEVVEGGFDVTYTQPLSDETVANIAQAYRAQQWRYLPTSTYGGPKLDEEVLSVSAATVSEDRRTVRLTLDGLKQGRVVHLRSPQPFASATGEKLWSTEAWYTLNSLPGYVSPADRGWYEAEEARLTGGAKVDWEHSGYSGAGFAGGMWSVGSAFEFTVDVDAAGTYPVNVRYANGPNPAPGAKDVNLYVNGQKIGPWEFPSTTDWKTWRTVTRDLDLQAGSNTIALKYDTGTKGNLNVDVLSLGAADICTPAQIEEGYRPLFDGTLTSLDGWRMAGPGGFGRQDDCSIRGEGGLGLLWHQGGELEDYSLKLDWKLVADHNGGVFVGFPDPKGDPWVAVNQGYEIQIDATDADDRTTGAIYTFQGADLDAVEAALNPVGSWNAYEIVVQGQTIKVFLNGTLVNDFTSTDPARDISQGFIGVQNHGGGEAVSYRNIRVMDIDEPAPLALTASAELRCLAKKASLTVRATNTDTVPVDVTLTSAWGERVIEDVQPGKSVFHTFTTRAASVPAGEATVSATADGRTGEATVAYAAKSCG